MTFTEVFLLYVCPSLGGVMSTMMFAAPINDMRDALEASSLGDLNPFPFAMMTGNTFGWIAYGYFMQDPMLVASNLPGFILSLWLNIGAAKIQYLAMKESHKTSVAERHQVLERWDADRVGDEAGHARQRRRQAEEGDGLFNTDNNDDDITLRASVEYMQMTPQETLLLRVLVFWAVVLTYTSWLYPHSGDPASLVGFIVNINLVVFYAAPLKTIQKVVTERNSASIHYETMIMNWINTSFWIGYGIARRDLVIIVPNATGLMLGLAQGLLCVLYPRHSHGAVAARLSLHEMESDLIINDEMNNNNSNPEETVPEPKADITAILAAGKSSASANAPEVI